MNRPTAAAAASFLLLQVHFFFAVKEAIEGLGTKPHCWLGCRPKNHYCLDYVSLSSWRPVAKNKDQRIAIPASIFWNCCMHLTKIAFFLKNFGEYLLPWAVVKFCKQNDALLELLRPLGGISSCKWNVLNPLITVTWVCKAPAAAGVSACATFYWLLKKWTLIRMWSLEKLYAFPLLLLEKTLLSSPKEGPSSRRSCQSSFWAKTLPSLLFIRALAKVNSMHSGLCFKSIVVKKSGHNSVKIGPYIVFFSC